MKNGRESDDGSSSSVCRSVFRLLRSGHRPWRYNQRTIEEPNVGNENNEVITLSITTATTAPEKQHCCFNKQKRYDDTMTGIVPADALALGIGAFFGT